MQNSSIEAIYMSTASKRKYSSAVENGSIAGAKVSAYDRVSSLLIALLALVGLAVVLLFLFWLSTIVDLTRRTPDIESIEFGGRGDHAQGVARDLEEPGVEELADVTEPQLSQTLESVTDAISNVQGAVEAFEGQALELGTGTSLGDSRKAGPGGEGDGEATDTANEFRFSEIDKKTYITLLDFFGIELGALGGKNGVDYASKFSQAKPSTRSGPSESDKRLYILPSKKKPIINKWDRELLEKAGINTRGRVCIKFVPDSVAIQLINLQRKEAGRNRTLDDVRATVFGVRRNGGNFEFYIIEQEYKFGS